MFLFLCVKTHIVRTHATEMEICRTGVLDPIPKGCILQAWHSEVKSLKPLGVRIQHMIERAA